MTSPAWEAQLAAQRGTFNAILAAARGAGASVDVLRAAMIELRPPVETLLRALPASSAAGACRALTELVADLAVRRLWHERSAERWAVLAVVPHLARAMDRSWRTTFEVVVEGAGRIARETDLGAWGPRLVAADALVDDDDALRAAAAVAAWRSGLVRVRRSALAAAERLNDDVLALVLDLPETTRPVRRVLEDNVADPFAWPGAPDRGVVAVVGGYRGLGGPWTGVPLVRAATGSSTPTWRVLADGIGWVVVADVHGHVVLREPTGPDAPNGTQAPGPVPVASDDAQEVAGLVPWEDEITGLARVTRPPQAPAGSPGPGHGHGAGASAVLVSRATSCALDLVLVPALAGSSAAPSARTSHESARS